MELFVVLLIMIYVDTHSHNCLSGDVVYSSSCFLAVYIILMDFVSASK